MVPFYVNHLGRHGARFPTSGKALNRVKEILELAQRENRLTSGGVTLLSTIQNLSETFDGQWGKLSVVGEEEQRGIARRMIERYPQLFSDSVKVQAIATYVPRCIHSMDAFLACMVEFNSSLHIQRNEGKQYNDILRFFDLNQSYVDYKEMVIGVLYTRLLCDERFLLLLLWKTSFWNQDRKQIRRQRNLSWLYSPLLPYYQIQVLR